MVRNLTVDTKETKFTRIITRNEEQFMAYINVKIQESVSGSGSSCNSYCTTVVTNNYNASESDNYIGVVSEEPVVIVLPPSLDGKTFMVKNEWGEKSGKITVAGSEGELIDRAEVYEFTHPFESATFISRGGNWYVI